MNYFGKLDKQIKELFLDLHKEDLFVLFCLSLFTGLYTLFLVIALFLSGNGIIEQEEFYIYILGWFLTPSVSIASTLLFVHINLKFSKNNPNILWLLLAINSMMFGLFATSLNFSWQFSRSLTFVSNLTYLALVIIPLINILVIRFCKYIPAGLDLSKLRLLTLFGMLGFINFVGLFPYFNDTYSIPLGYFVIALVVGSGIGAFSYRYKFRISSNQKKGWIYILDLLIVFLIAVICFDPSLKINVTHQNFYLGPVNQILHGGTMLVDTFCQYGNLSIYLLALVFGSHILPFSYQGFSFLIAFLLVLQFIIVYVFLIKLVKKRFYAILLLLLSLLLAYFCVGGSIQAYPSTGPFRFGLAYVLLAVIILRDRFHSLSKVFLFFEYFLIGFAFLWSFETFIYVGFSYISIFAYESFSKPVTFKAALKAFSVRLAYFLLSMILAVGLFSLFTYFRAKTLPNWDIYLDFIKSYTPAVGIGNELIDTWSPWIFPVSIYFSSLMFFLFRYFYLNYRKTTIEDKIILFLTFFGIAQFTYYLGRSHPNALFLISIPSVVIMGYWLVVFSQSNRISKSLGFASRMVFYSCAMLIILGSWPVVNAKIRNNQTGLAVFNINNLETLTPNSIQDWLLAERTLLHSNSDDSQIAEAHKLIKKYMLEKEAIPVFLSPDNTTEILISTNRIHSFSVSHFMEDSISLKNIKRIMDYPSPLKIGDYMLIEENPSNYENYYFYDLAAQLLNRICRDFSFQEMESSFYGISVVRLIPHDESSKEYCEKINQLKIKVYDQY